MPTLSVYILEHCFGCEEARRLATAIAGSFANLRVRVVDLDDEPDARPDNLIAVPTYMLDGKVIALGNPRQIDLVHDLEHLLESRRREEHTS
ncbi:MAG: hypothetical protein IT305_31490 [Chloroflexi bacterium]|nr:hypothetical protein [Chloroflexota bacterium]